MELHTIGIDLGKTVFHLVGLDLHGEVVVRKKFSRTQLLRFTASVHVGLIGMEACGGSHFLGRALREQRHEVRLIPAQYVKPYVKTNKSDYIDARGWSLQLGWGWFLANTLPAASRGCSVSVNVETLTCEDCSCRAHVRSCYSA
jgi:transposase